MKTHTDANNAPVAVLVWRSLGPYHVARAAAAARLLCERRAVRTIVIELSDEEQTRGWRIDRSDLPVELRTLSPGTTLNERTPALSSSLIALLDELGPRYLAIAGYDRPEMRSALHWARSNGAAAVLMSETKWDDSPRPWWKRKLISWLVRQFDAALVSGGPATEYMVALGMPRERIFRQYGAVDNGFFASAAQRAREGNLRPRADLPRDYFLACCRLIESRKNVKRLILAYERYRATIGLSAWALVIVGDGADRAAYERLVRDRRSQGVHFEGFKQVDELALYYAHAGCFVHPATNEAWGLVVNEAMACGLPVLVSRRCGCAYDLVTEGANGFTFDPANDAELSRLMCKISAAPQQRRCAMGEASREIIAGFGVEQFARGLCNAFDVAKRCGPGATA